MSIKSRRPRHCPGFFHSANRIGQIDKIGHTEMKGNQMSQTNHNQAVHSVEQIASKYAQSLSHGRPGVSAEPRDYHFKFAEAIISKNAYALEHLANGLNDTGKKVFSDVTGVKLPRTQQATWAALMVWAGINPLQDAADRAKGNVEREKRFLSERNVTVSEHVYETFDEAIKNGAREIKTISGNRYLTDGSKGINLSERGTGRSLMVDYIKARIKYQVALEALENTAAVENKLSKAA